MWIVHIFQFTFENQRQTLQFVMLHNGYIRKMVRHTNPKLL